MPKKTLSPEDLDLFKETVGSVKPVDNNKVEPKAPKPSARITKKNDFQHEMLSETTDWDFQIQSGDSLQYLATGLQRMGWTPGMAICLTGGIGPHYAKYLAKGQQADLIAPKGPPIDGAIALARLVRTQ